MKSDEFFDYLKSQFCICNADMGNLPHRTRLEEDKETGESILPMPKEVYGDYAELDDVISFKKASKSRIKLINMSCKVVFRTRFTREYNSINRQLSSAKNPLNRVIVNTQKRHYLLKLSA
ncbi:MAG: hypothetical protein GY928_05230 [Colwellia sp.]|nr:hypothetical protein [Colwellia sp.]